MWPSLFTLEIEEGKNKPDFYNLIFYQATIRDNEITVVSRVTVAPKEPGTKKRVGSSLSKQLLRVPEWSGWS